MLQPELKTRCLATRRARVLAALILLLASTVPALAGKEPKKRVAVTAFENAAGRIDPKFGDVGRGLTIKLIDALNDTGKFVIVEREALDDIAQEQNLDQIFEVAPGEESRITTAQALVRGVITSLEIQGGDGGGLGIKRFRIGGGKQTAKVKLNIRVIDTTTSQIIETKSVEGTAQSRSFGIRGRVEGLDADYDGERTTPLSDAIEDAVAQAVAGIVAGMEKLPWQGSIVRVSGRQIFINAGSEENVEEGMRLRVFEKGIELIDTETNVSLGHLDEEIGIVEIAQVAPRFSVARVIQGQGFAAGNIVKPAHQFSTADVAGSLER